MKKGTPKPRLQETIETVELVFTKREFDILQVCANHDTGGDVRKFCQDAVDVSVEGCIAEVAEGKAAK